MVLDIGKLYLLRTMQSRYFPVNMLVCVIPSDKPKFVVLIIMSLTQLKLLYENNPPGN